MIRVLVVEDSATARQLLVEVLQADPEVRVVGEAVDGAQAVELTRRLHPNVVTMDVHMPGIDGFEATRRIMAEAPTPIVIVSAHVDVKAVATSMRALAVGALAVLSRPAGPTEPDFDEQRRYFVGTVKALAGVKVVRRQRSQPPDSPRAQAQIRGSGGLAASSTAGVGVVAIVASTGGPAALRQVLGGLGVDFCAPVLVVQHMSQGFLPGFASWLDGTVALQVKVAEAGENLVPATVYVAPDDRHLGVSSAHTVQLSQSPKMDGFRPAGSALFQSVAEIYGAATVAVVLTGMGQDGVEGLRSVRQAGGRIVVQDEETSVVFGMPGAAILHGLHDEVLPLGAIGPRLLALARLAQPGRTRGT